MDINSASSRGRRPLLWFGVIASACLGLSLAGSACSSSGEDSGASNGDNGSSGGDNGPGSSGSAPAGPSGSPGATDSPGAMASSGAPGGAGGGKLPDGSIATAANLKVAFIGDTASKAGFKSVLDLIKRESAQMVIVQGDLTYDGEKASDWLPVADAAINTAAAQIPYFAARGNHDVDWGTMAPALKTRMTSWSVTPSGDVNAGNYTFEFKGLKVVMANTDETAPTTRADYVKAELATDNHVWKICSWHKNQRASNVGPKSDEMGWAIYENCRDAAAIVAQGHSHTYSRSKTITNDTNQAVDPACSGPFALCVSKGRHFFFDSSLGGKDIRALENTNHPYWATTYSGAFGALFITFNVDGDPMKARGYFKTVADTIVDPPASSGQTSFTITRSN